MRACPHSLKVNTRVRQPADHKNVDFVVFCRSVCSKKCVSLDKTFALQRHIDYKYDQCPEGVCSFSVLQTEESDNSA